MVYLKNRRSVPAVFRICDARRSCVNTSTVPIYFKGNKKMKEPIE